MKITMFSEQSMPDDVLLIYTGHDKEVFNSEFTIRDAR